MGPPESLHDDQLIDRICAGRLEFFEVLIDRHLSHIRAFTAFQAPSFGQVDAITHGTFVFALEHIHLFKTGTEFRGWLRAVALKLVRAEIEHARTQPTGKFEKKRLAELERGENDPYSAPDVEFLEACVRQLPEALGGLVKLHYREGKPTDKIALSLGRSVASVRLNLFRLRQELRRSARTKVKEASHAR